MLVIGGNDTTIKRVVANTAAIGLLARVEDIDVSATSPPAVSAQIVVDEATFALPLKDIIDVKAETARLQKEIKRLDDEVVKIDAKLANGAFMSRAPEDVVEEQRKRRAQAKHTRDRLSTALKHLQG